MVRLILYENKEGICHLIQKGYIILVYIDYNDCLHTLPLSQKPQSSSSSPKLFCIFQVLIKKASFHLKRG